MRNRDALWFMYNFLNYYSYFAIFLWCHYASWHSFSSSVCDMHICTCQPITTHSGVWTLQMVSMGLLFMSPMQEMLHMKHSTGWLLSLIPTVWLIRDSHTLPLCLLIFNIAYLALRLPSTRIRWLRCSVPEEKKESP